jgi:hypothetical protein
MSIVFRLQGQLQRSIIFYLLMTLLFFKADATNAQAVQNSLTSNCEASGQRVNLAKSSILFSK